MLGNVWQWTADWYGASYYQPGERQDPPGPPGGTMRTLRGGSWYDDPKLVRASYRSGYEPGYSSYAIGLRCIGE
jgi:formylglycine-generating enzyme required for sulfatase activity